ncbi:phage holin family protein [Trabulsiella odontotermitis]|uniref:phage holin family protein n=1 Tax=Trabulsiella odontotermitis TaxID=379893 RepID=UPI000675EEB7|nr:phage holin family protein [Trabulsiella odontotermitis]
MSQLWENSLKWIAENMPAISAGLAGAGVSALMNIKDGKPKKYTITSACVCGIIGISVAGIMGHFGLERGWEVFFGCVVGFLGADKLRDIANNVVNNRLNNVKSQQGNKNENQ